MKLSVFYSWQSDIESKLNRSFIQNSLGQSISRINKVQFRNTSNTKTMVELVLDQATRNTKGSPDIATTIFDKIYKSSLFLADVSIVVSSKNKSYPNSNVLIELGYAASVLGWENIIMIFNQNSGVIEDLPFDIRGRRILSYNLSLTDNPTRKKIIKQNLTNSFATILSDRITVINPLVNHPMVKILPYIKNRIVISYNYWRRFISDLYKAIGEDQKNEDEFVLVEIERISAKINPQTSKRKGNDIHTFTNWYQYIAYISTVTYRNINEIFVFQDKIDFSLIGLLSRASSGILNQDLTNINKKKFGNTDMKFLSHSIFTIIQLLSQVIRQFDNLYEEHQREYHKQFRANKY